MPEMLKVPPRRMVTIDVDSELAERLSFVSKLEGISEEELLVRIIEGYPKRAGQRSLTAGVSAAAAARLAAAAATSGMHEEELIAEAIDTYSPPEVSVSSWLVVGVLGLLLVLPLALMFASPRIGPSGSVTAWLVFAAAVLAGCLAALVLVMAVIYTEWVVIRYGVAGLTAVAACGTAGVLSVFAYAYWLFSNLSPASFNLPLSRVDAVYFTLGTFTTTGTGRLSAHSAGAELLVCSQVVLGWGFVAMLLALLVPRAVATYRRLSNGRIIVRTGKTPS